MVPLASVDGGSEPGTGRNTFVYTQSVVNSAAFANDPNEPFPRFITGKRVRGDDPDFSELIVDSSIQEKESSFQPTPS
jgi:hypothetical protein